MSNGAVKVALVGLGGWGRNLAEVALRCPALELVAGYDEQEAARAAFETRFHVFTTPDYRDLANPEIEAVIVATPNATHAALTSFYARDLSKHVFVEKPIAATVAEARQMQADCRAAGVTLMVGHNSRRYASHRLL